MVIERTFGALKGRFRRLKYVDIQDIEKIVKVVISCCVLHEYCLQHDDDCLVYIEEGGEDEINNYVEIFLAILQQVKKGRVLKDFCELFYIS